MMSEPKCSNWTFFVLFLPLMFTCTTAFQFGGVNSTWAKMYKKPVLDQSGQPAFERGRHP